MDKSHQDKIAVYSNKFRLVGGWFFVLGGFMFLLSLVYLFDPEAVITINGKETNEFPDKLFVSIFCSIFVVVGLFLSF